MSRTRRVLHLASFRGNIGDNINHSGFRPWFSSLCDAPVEWRSLEIRRFYRGDLNFSNDLLEFAKEADAMVMGGGNYLELWPSNTVSGMSLDLPLDKLSALGKPVFLNSLGVDGGQGVSERARQGLRDLVDWIASDSRRLLSVRNDGSYAQLEEICTSSSLKSVHRAPDAGFFQTMSQRAEPRANDGPPRIAVNLAMDMRDLRYPGGDALSYTEFCTMFAGVMEAVSLAHGATAWVFVPHIYSDLQIISDVLAQLPDALLRTQVDVAAYGSGDQAARAAMMEYAASSLVLGMRFHSCIAGLSLGRPTLGLVTYPQVAKLFCEVGAPDLAIDVQSPTGMAKLLEAVLASLVPAEDPSAVGAEVLYRVGSERRRFEPILATWLSEAGLTSSRGLESSC